MKYLLALYGEETDIDDLSPEELKAGLDPWSEYGRQALEAGVFIAGEGLQESTTAKTIKIRSEGDPLVTDGPFAETKEQLGGFYLLECESLEEAVSWAKKIPLQPSGSIEVRPVMDYTKYGYARPNAAATMSS